MAVDVCGIWVIYHGESSFAANAVPMSMQNIVKYELLFCACGAGLVLESDVAIVSA